MATGWTENRRRYRQYKARTERLPANYHTAIDALEQYLEFFGPGRATACCRCWMTSPISSSRPRRTEPRSARSSGRTPWSSPRRFFGTTRRVSGSAESGNG